MYHFKLQSKNTPQMSGPIVEYSHNLLDASGKWANQWQEGDEHICWYDGHPFDWFPVPVPTSYDESRKTYRVFGTFCCFQCAKAWQINNPSFNTPISRSWLAVMAKELFGFKHPVIFPAPDQWVLLSKKMSIDEFRQQCKHNEPVETVHPPLLPACMASISGKTSDVLASICTTRNNETVGGQRQEMDTPSGQLSVYEKYLSEQHQPHAEEADTSAAIDMSTKAPSPTTAETVAPSATASSAFKKKKAKKTTTAGTLANFMRK